MELEFSQEKQIKKTEELYLSARARIPTRRFGTVPASLEPVVQDVQWAEKAV